MRFERFVGVLAVLGLFSIQGISTALASVEVVESFPIETNLNVSAARSTQDVWVEMISSAKNSIDLEQFYVSSQAGESLEPVLNALRAAAARGVHIRFMIDQSFYKNYSTIPDQLAKVSGIEMKKIDFSSLGGIQHSKYFIVDGMHAYVGSANFDWLALTHIHEIGLHVVDAQTGANLEAIFEKDWKSASASMTAPVMASSQSVSLGNSDAGVGVVASPSTVLPAGTANTLDALIQMIGAARSSIKIQNYEYNTSLYHSAGRWSVLDAAVRKAAARGVHVQLLLDATALKAGKKDIQALQGLANVQVKIVTIPQWSGGAIPYARVIHSKYMIVDDTSAWVGSENWSGSYFTSSRNVGLTVQDAQAVAVLNQVYSQVWSSPYAAN